MNLKMTLAAAAVAAVAAAPVVSHADATLYGKVQLGLSQAGKTTAAGKATTSFFDNGTRFGIKGSDALGSDMTSFYKMEFATPGMGSASDSISSYGTDPSSGFKTRYAYIGVKGNFGTAVGGRVEDLFYAMVEAPTDTPNAIGGSLGPTGDGYVSRVNAVAYMTPDLGGFTGGVAVGNIGTDNTSTSQTYGKQQQVYELGGKYTFGPGYVSAAYIAIPKNDAQLGQITYNGTQIDALKSVAGIAAGYSFGMFGIDGNVTKTAAHDSSAKIMKVTQATIQGSMTMGALYGYVMYSQAKNDESGSKTANRITAGVFYNVSKPLMVSFEVASNNKYTNSTQNSSLTSPSFTPASWSPDTNGNFNGKANTEFAVALLYNF